MSWELAAILLGGIATLAIFSFLIKENPFFRFFEHLFIGISVGFGIIITIKTFFYTEMYLPLSGSDIYYYPDGTQSQEYNSLLLLYFIPAAFGLLYYFIYSKKYQWLAKLVIGFSLGASGGLAFKGFFNRVIPQVSGSFKPLVVLSEGQVLILESLQNIIFVFTLLACLYYFFFSFKQTNVASQSFRSSGRILLMVCFGAFFGSTVMARMALLVERLQFLIDKWVPAVWGLFT